MSADLRFWFDPVCPFAWLASRWVHEVVALRDYEVEWRLVSLRLLNEDVDYDSHFPEEYEEGHTTGLQLLRVCAAVRDEHGPGPLGPLYDAFGERIWEIDPPADRAAHQREVRSRPAVEQVLTSVGLPTDAAAALEDASWDDAVRQDTELALSLTGEDVGTPIIQVRPPDGTGFFGPVISRVPRGEDATRLWDHLVALTAFPGFAELKRSLRERPQLQVLGWSPERLDPPVEEDWHAGSRAADRPGGDRARR